jgi:hypothetical protein
MRCKVGRHENQWTVKHRMHGSPSYSSWASMRDRCNNPKSKDFPRYGGRGIAICAEWEYFEAFYADMGDRPEGMSLDRINNDAGYGPENCRWATPTMQTRNRRNALHIEFRGERRPLKAWCVEFGLKYGTASDRIFKYGMTPEEAFTRPLRAHLRRQST